MLEHVAVCGTYLDVLVKKSSFDYVASILLATSRAVGGGVDPSLFEAMPSGRVKALAKRCQGRI